MITKFDNKGWEINKTELWYPEKSLSFNVDEIFENQEKTSLVYFRY
jgi:hypothetical protein